MCSDALKHMEALLSSKIAKSMICHSTLVTVIMTIIKVKCNLIRKTYKITIVKDQIEQIYKVLRLKLISGYQQTNQYTLKRAG